MGAFSGNPTPHGQRVPLVSVALDCEETDGQDARFQKVWEADGQATEVRISGILLVRHLRKGKRYRITIEETD